LSAPAHKIQPAVESIEWLFRGLKDLPLVERPAPVITEQETESLSDTSTGSPYENSFRELRATGDTIRKCVRCGLHTGRIRSVPGSGNPRARLLIVTPPPNKEDQLQGIPLSGKEGQLLERMLLAMRLGREQVFLAPIIKCPLSPERSLQPEEIDTCQEYLEAQIRIVAPDVVLAMGELPAQTLMREEALLAKIRGRWSRFHDRPLIATWDPQSLLQKPERKRQAWDDLQKVMARLEAEEL